ncbi:hypothetical protein LCGC14_2664500 [marine sediment metagenome]|uniref:Uncharacterized protein n=1 Tax=marine sediment metagenome TaxID=412755 RepID=A0A0F9ADB3_9ZZZZ
MEEQALLETWQVVVLVILFVGGLIVGGWGIHNTPPEDCGF